MSWIAQFVTPSKRSVVTHNNNNNNNNMDNDDAIDIDHNNHNSIFVSQSTKRARIDPAVKYEPFHSNPIFQIFYFFSCLFYPILCTMSSRSSRRSNNPLSTM
jgi:hypothetical protein